MGEQEEEELYITIRDISVSIVMKLRLIPLGSVTLRKRRGDAPPVVPI